MSKQPINYPKSDEVLQIHRSELLEVILNQEASPWFWNPADPEVEVCLSEVEADFSLVDGLDDDELTRGAESLFSHLNQCWGQASVSTVKQSLWTRFSSRIPSSMLDAIIANAQKMVALNLSPLEQLIQCVKPLLDHWTEEDLQIFARPLVYAMRGSTETKQAPWDELSEVDQVRLTMKVAQEVLTQLQQEKQDG